MVPRILLLPTILVAALGAYGMGEFVKYGTQKRAGDTFVKESKSVEAKVLPQTGSIRASDGAYRIRLDGSEVIFFSTKHTDRRETIPVRYRALTEAPANLPEPQRVLFKAGPGMIEVVDDETDYSWHHYYALNFGDPSADLSKAIMICAAAPLCLIVAVAFQKRMIRTLEESAD